MKSLRRFFTRTRMDLHFSLGSIFLLIALAINVVLAVVVFAADWRSATNRIFGMLAITTSVWLVMNYLSVQPENVARSLLWIRMSLFFATPLNVLFFLLSYTVPNSTLRLRGFFFFIVLCAAAVVMAVSVSPLTFRTVAVVAEQPVPTAGPGIALFGLFSIAMNLGAIAVLVRRLRGPMEPVERKQTILVTEGIVIMFGLIITTIFLPLVFFGSNQFVYLMPLYTLLFLLMTAYAVVAYRLFNIKVIATEAVTTMLLIVLLSRAVVAENAAARLINVVIFGMTTVLSLMLVRGVRKEIQQREEVERLAARLQDLSDMKSNFVSIASHQLRAPIGGVRGYLLLMQEGDYGKMPKKVMDVFGQCVDQLDHLLHVINMFLDITKMESGKIELTKEKTDLRPLAESAVKDNQRGAENKGLKLTLELPKQSLEAEVDGAKIREIMFNFIENAIKYTQTGSIAASLARTSDAVEFRVKDTGMGIVPEEVPKLFAKFVRAGGGFRVAHGSGLGLYIAKTMAEAHGGTVFVESEGEGKGSTFGFRLPMPAEKTPVKTVKKGKK